MGDTARFRRLASAACLVVGPALLLATTIVLPWQNDQDAAATLQLAGDETVATQVGDLLAFLGILAMIPATLAVMRVLRRRAPVLALVGGAISIAGWVSAMIIVVTDQINIGLADATGAREAIATALEGSSAWVLNIVLAGLLLGILVGPIVLGAGLMRARVVAVWAGAAVAASGVITVAAFAGDLQALDIVASAVYLIGLLPVARLVGSVSDAEWDTGEIPSAAGPHREPVAA